MALRAGGGDRAGGTFEAPRRPKIRMRPVTPPRMAPSSGVFATVSRGRPVLQLVEEEAESFDDALEVAPAMNARSVAPAPPAPESHRASSVLRKHRTLMLVFSALVGSAAALTIVVSLFRGAPAEANPTSTTTITAATTETRTTGEAVSPLVIDVKNLPVDVKSLPSAPASPARKRTTHRVRSVTTPAPAAAAKAEASEAVANAPSESEAPEAPEAPQASVSTPSTP